MNPDESQIVAFLERYGAALSNGDLPEIAASWAVPSLVLSDEGAIAVTDPAQVTSFFGQAVAWYRSNGIAATEPALELAEALSERLTAVEVRWAQIDAAGAELGSELSAYILHRGDDGQLRIRVALTRPEPQ